MLSELDGFGGFQGACNLPFFLCSDDLNLLLSSDTASGVCDFLRLTQNDSSDFAVYAILVLAGKDADVELYTGSATEAEPGFLARKSQYRI